MKIKVSKSNDCEKKAKPSLHLINCQVNVGAKQENKTFPIEQYFGKQFEFESNNSAKNRLKASFRGRPLDGMSVTLPQGYTFAKTTQKKDDLVAQDVGKEAIYWNLDKIVSSNDVLPQVIEWLTLSQAIHAHVSPSS